MKIMGELHEVLTVPEFKTEPAVLVNCFSVLVSVRATHSLANESYFPKTALILLTASVSQSVIG